MQLEIDRKPDTAASSCADHGPAAAPAADGADDVIKQLFQGELISEVRSFLQSVLSAL